MGFTDKQIEELIENLTDKQKEELIRNVTDKLGSSKDSAVPKMTQALPKNTQNRRSIVDLYENKEIWFQSVIGQLNSQTSGATKQNAIKRITNIWTRDFGNYIGCKFWTKEALDIYENTLGSPTVETGLSEHFTHEHAMPQNTFIQIFTKPQIEFAVMALLYNGLNGVVVTKDQDALLNSKYQSTVPPSFSKKDEDWELMWLNPWARYIDMGITNVYLCEWGNDNQLVKKDYFEIRRDFRISECTNF